MKKHNKEAGPALVGIELTNRKDYLELIRNLDFYKINYTELKKNDDAFGYLV
jgi:threonine dehydratase